MEILTENMKVWLLNHGIPIILILIVAWISKRVLKIAIVRFEKNLEQKSVSRSNTIMHQLQSKI